MFFFLSPSPLPSLPSHFILLFFSIWSFFFLISLPFPFLSATPSFFLSRNGKERERKLELSFFAFILPDSVVWGRYFSFFSFFFLMISNAQIQDRFLFVFYIGWHWLFLIFPPHFATNSIRIIWFACSSIYILNVWINLACIYRRLEYLIINYHDLPKQTSQFINFTGQGRGPRCPTHLWSVKKKRKK